MPPKQSSLDLVEMAALSIGEQKIRQNKEPKEPKVTFSQDEIKQITDLSMGRTADAAVKLWAADHPLRVPAVSTVNKYKSYFKEFGTYFTPGKSGPKELLNAEQRKILFKAAAKLRDKHKSIDATTFGAMAKGIYKNTGGKGADLVSGLYEFSASWARATMHAHGFRPRAATTDRTVAATEVVKLGKAFYLEVAAFGVATDAELMAAGIEPLGDTPRVVVPRCLVFNFDEFFTSLGENANWTWERIKKGEKRNIAIASEKQGFTSSILCSATGELHLVQCIFDGKTDRVHASDIQHEKLLQQHNKNDTHFQNAITFGEWLERFVLIVRRVRVANQLDTNSPAILIMDQAPQHIYDEDALAAHKITIVKVPKKCTHVFQPCDQFVISGFKQHAKKAWSKVIEQAFEKNELNEAVDLLTATSLPVRRNRKVKCLVEAIDAMRPEQIVKSWGVSGILRALGVRCEKNYVVAFDGYVEMAEEMVTDCPPLDSDCEDDDRAVAEPKEKKTRTEVIVSLPAVQTPLPSVAPSPRGRPKGSLNKTAPEREAAKAIKATQPRAITSVLSMLCAAATKKEEASAKNDEAIECKGTEVVEVDQESDPNHGVNCIE